MICDIARQAVKTPGSHIVHGAFTLLVMFASNDIKTINPVLVMELYSCWQIFIPLDTVWLAFFFLLVSSLYAKLS